MAKVIVNLKRVQVFETESGCNVNLVFNPSIEGYRRVIDDNGVVNYEKGDVDSVSIPRSACVAQLCEAESMIAAYRGTIDHSFGQKEFGIILRDSTLELERIHHEAGEVYATDDDGTELAYSRDCYTTTITDVKLSDWSLNKIDAALTL